jgi:hypothetical protein
LATIAGLGTISGSSDIVRFVQGGVVKTFHCAPTGLPMTINRIIAGALSLVLLVLLGWAVFAGVGDIRTWVMLGFGAVLGLLYTVIGRVPDWIVNYSGGSITDDDDPSNISPRVYLPILFGVIVVAVTTMVLVLRVL